MTRITPAILLLVFAISAGAGGDGIGRAVEDLFSEDPAARDTARAVVRDAGAEAIPLLLERIEAHVGGRDRTRDVVELFDIRDLVADEHAGEEILARLRGAVGDAADIERKAPGTLVVHASAATVAEIRELLDVIRSGADRVVTIATRVLRVPEGAEVPESGAEGADTLAAPLLTCFNGQRANIRIVRRIPCVRDFEVTVTEDGTIADPVVEELADGITIDVRPVAARGVAQIQLHLNVRVARVTEPMGVVERACEGGTKVRVQVPEIRETSLVTTATVADGGEVLVDVGNDPAGGRLFLRISARAILPGFLRELGVRPDADPPK